MLYLQRVFKMPETEPEMKMTSVLLIGAGTIAAGEHGVPLWGIEVVYYMRGQEPLPAKRQVCYNE